MTTLWHPPYSPDLASTNVYLFPHLKFAVKGKRYKNTDYITVKAMKQLKEVCKNGKGFFPKTLQMLAEVCSCQRKLL